MIGAAARAGDHGARCESAQLRAERRDRGGVVLQLRAHRVRRAGGLLKHARALDGWCAAFMWRALNSATKS